jgi:hypothetical protein
MKKINSFFYSILMMLVCLFSVQTVFAVDVPLKKGDTGAGGVNLMLSRSVSAAIPVSVSLDGTELGIFFNKSVGVAQVTVVDETGSVVYQDVIDSNSTIEAEIEVGGFDSGNYSLQITYGSTKLVGTFQL